MLSGVLVDKEGDADDRPESYRKEPDRVAVRVGRGHPRKERIGWHYYYCNTMRYQEKGPAEHPVLLYEKAEPVPRIVVPR